MKFTVNQLAELVEGQVRGSGSVEISAAAPADNGKPGEISFVLTEAHLATARRAQASCLIIPPYLDCAPVPAIVVDEPKLAFARALRALYPLPELPPGVHDSAVIADGATLGGGVHVAAQAYVGPGARLGAGVVVGPGAVVEADAYVGRDSFLHARSVVGPGCVLGERVIVHSGAVLGADGFGYVTTQGRHEKFPQVGIVSIGDDVEIGANTSIDRGSLQPTTVGSGTKIDNLVQVGHNVQIGKHCLICAQVGIAGSAEIGDHVIIGGQSAVGDHCVIESGALFGATSGIVPGKRVRGGQMYFGAPARPVAKAKRQMAAQLRLPALMQRVKAIEEKLGIRRSQRADEPDSE
jgi:UDP-3-O-[3-hydroxymyristoyl] glucosamine N-acyltransferase